MTPQQKDLAKLTLVKVQKKDESLFLLDKIHSVEDQLPKIEEKLKSNLVSIDEKIDTTRQELIDIIQSVPAPLQGEKGDKGDSYILTSADKKEIAKSIMVPIVEKETS